MNPSMSFLEIWMTSYTLSLGELGDFDQLSTVQFVAFSIFTIMITIVLLNLVIAIMSDKYGEVMASKEETECRVMLENSLEFEKFRRFFNPATKQTYHYMYVRSPAAAEDDEEE